MLERNYYNSSQLSQEFVDIINKFWSEMSKDEIDPKKITINTKNKDMNIFVIVCIYIYGSIVNDKNINIESEGFVGLINIIIDKYKDLHNTNKKFNDFVNMYYEIINNESDVSLEFLNKLEDVNQIAFKYSDSSYWEFLIILIGLSCTNVLGEIEIIKFSDEEFMRLNEKYGISKKCPFIRTCLTLDAMNVKRYLYSMISDMCNVKELDEVNMRRWGMDIPKQISVAMLMNIAKSEDMKSFGSEIMRNLF